VLTPVLPKKKKKKGKKIKLTDPKSVKNIKTILVGPSSNFTNFLVTNVISININSD
jgi:hypothetical protein